MPKAQDAANWTNPPLFKRPAGVEGPLVSTLAGKRDGSRPVDEPDPEPTPSQGLIFSESFDDQPDWHSELPENDLGGLPLDGVDVAQWEGKHTIPQGWNAVRQAPTWSPEQGHPDRHPVIEINDATIAENPNRRRGATGKSFVTWRDAYTAANGKWNSDGLLVKYLGDNYDEVYLEYWANFSNECIASFYDDKLGVGKMARVISHDDPLNYSWNDYYRFFGTANKPIVLSDFGGGTTYGIRNLISIYRYSDGVTTNDDINEGLTGYPSVASPFDNGDASLGYWPEVVAGQGIGGTDPVITDYRDGGTIDSGGVAMDQVFGDETVWVKIGLYVKMSSAPGAKDGLFQQFLNDERILSLGGIQYIPAHAPMKKWNMVIIGGNDYMPNYDPALRHEEWYAIDDMVIRDSLPDHLVES